MRGNVLPVVSSVAAGYTVGLPCGASFERVLGLAYWRGSSSTVATSELAATAAAAIGGSCATRGGSRGAYDWVFPGHVCRGSGAERMGSSSGFLVDGWIFYMPSDDLFTTVGADYGSSVPILSSSEILVQYRTSGPDA